MKDQDSEDVRKLLKRKDRVEAIRWLSGGPSKIHRGIGELGNRESVEFVEGLYRAGAKEVVAIDIGSSPDQRFESTDTLIVTLPDDSASRKRIFKSEEVRLSRIGYTVENDTGQRHLLVWFD